MVRAVAGFVKSWIEFSCCLGELCAKFYDKNRKGECPGIKTGGWMKGRRIDKDEGRIRKGWNQLRAIF